MYAENENRMQQLVLELSSLCVCDHAEFFARFFLRISARRRHNSTSGNYGNESMAYLGSKYIQYY